MPKRTSSGEIITPEYSAIVPRRLFSDTVPGMSRQMSYYRRRTGRRRPRSNSVKQHTKLIKTVMDYYVLKWNRLNPKINGASRGTMTLGNQAMSYYLDPVLYDPDGGSPDLLSTDMNYPIHLYDLTSCINDSGQAGTTISASPALRLVRVLRENGQYSPFQWRFNYQRHNDSLLVDDFTRHWEKYLTNVRSPDARPGKRGILDYMNLKLQVTAPTKTPMSFFVDLVQFNGDMPTPRSLATLDRYGVNDIAETARIGEHEGLFDALVKPLVFNPIADSEPGAYKQIKFLKSWKFNFEPETTIDKDITGQRKIINLFHRFNRTCNYNWAAEGQTALGVNTKVSGEMKDVYEFSRNENFAYVEPSARVYLMIRATNQLRPEAVYTGVTGDQLPPNTDWDPTYDINLKTKFIFQN